MVVIVLRGKVSSTYKSISAMLVLPTNSKAVAVVGVAFGGILINLMFPFLL